MSRGSCWSPALLAAALALSSCSGSGSGDPGDSESPQTNDGPAAESTEAISTDVTSPSLDTVSTEALVEAPAPLNEGVALADGVPLVELLGPPASGAGRAPLFSWTEIEGAASYRLAVLGPDGPTWAWAGTDTQVYLGGLSFEQPPGWTGPVIEQGSCWSVVARSADGHVIAVSRYQPVSPGESPGHSCVPGATP